MPEISVLPAVPAAPAAPVAPALGQTPARDGANTQADAGIASFVTALQTALGTLGLLPQTTAPIAPQSQPVAEQPLPSDDDDDTDEVMPELLATLGFVPVPMQLQPAVLVEATAEAVEAVGSSSAQPLPMFGSQVVAPVAQAADQDSAAPASAEMPATEGAPAAPSSEVQQQNAPAQQIDQPRTSVPQPSTPQLTPQAAPQPQPQMGATQVAPETLPRQEQPSRSARAEHPTASTDAVAAQPTVSLPIGTQLQQGSGDSTTSSDSDSSSTDANTGTEATSGPARGDAATPAFAVATTQHVAAQQQPEQVRPSHVVGQIAHQADLYRLPGGRGVRIQLHPDDLGGVGVTVKYGMDGSVAATAELVQSGWSDLRDALSLQGIAPERLIMSVSGPGDASSSNSNNPFRSDAGQAGFSQAQQQQQERESARGSSRGWNGPMTNDLADDQREQVASTSRIDYRA